MLKEQCHIGMIIEFGRENGEKTRGEVVKMNPKMAKVKILEARGRNSQQGAVWNVGYGLMTEVKCWNQDWGPVPTVEYKNPADEDFAYNPFTPACDVSIMEAIVDVYNRLSPEWLTADGERPVHQIHALRGNLQRKLDYLFKALGRPVSESVAYKWLEQKSAEKV
jgi:hypothetical protein